jgi:hypothetical protein
MIFKGKESAVIILNLVDPVKPQSFKACMLLHLEVFLVSVKEATGDGRRGDIRSEAQVSTEIANQVPSAFSVGE